MISGAIILSYSKKEFGINDSSTALTDTTSDEKLEPTDSLFYIDGQLCQHLRIIFEDNAGNLWFGTNVYGLMRYNGEVLEYFNKENGYDFGRVTEIIQDKDGAIWIASYRGLAKFESNSFTYYTEEDGLLNNELWCITIDSNGLMWIGTNNGVNTFDGNTFSRFELPRAHIEDRNTIYAYDRIVSIVEDKSGALWFGTDGFGLTKYDGTNFSFYTTTDGLNDNTISELMIDSKGNLWIGTYFGGVSKYDGKMFQNYTLDKVIEGIEVGAFFEDEQENIWFAAENNGVYKYNGESFTNFNDDHSLNTNGILSIYKDQKSRFWFGGWGGLFRFNGELFSSVTKDGPWEID
jgi:ligand-binding sensor domain-containing protein